MIKKRLIELLAHARKYIVFNVIFQWIALLAQVVSVFYIANLIEKVYFDMVKTSDIKNTVMVLGLAIVIRMLCDKMATRASYNASVDVKRILRDKIYEKLLRLGVSYREQVKTSEVVQVSTEGVEQLETYFGKYLPQLFYSLLAPITLFVILSRVSLKASVVLLICVPLIPISIVVVQKIAKRLLNRYWSVYTQLGDSFLENLQGLTTLKIYQADEKKAMEMDEEAQHFRKITMKVLTMQLNSTSVMDIIAYGGAAIGMVVAIFEFLAGNIRISSVVTIVLLSAEFFLPMRLLGSFFHIAMNGMAASDKIFRLLDLEEPIYGSERLLEGQIDIKFSNVHFSYEKEKEILKGIDLIVPSNGLVSLVGVSGCGKSTIASLLCGKNKGYTGEIKIGGKNLNELEASELLIHITVVRHNSYLFKGTVEENLKMANDKASVSMMEEALKKVNLYEFFNTQEGLRTKLSERAGNLSGGQCQRLAIARALLHDTPIYIFDEATSNIDAESEELIMEVIKELAKTKTILLISHRLSNVVTSNCIYLLKEGRIQESGTHKELMDKGGSYYHLYKSQRSLEQYGKGKEA